MNDLRERIEGVLQEMFYRGGSNAKPWARDAILALVNETGLRAAALEKAERRLNGECETCGGSGVMSVLVRVELPDGHEVYGDEECAECHGTGIGWIGEWIGRAKKAEAALATPTEKAAPHSSGFYSDYPNGIALSTDKSGVVLNEAYQLICPLTQGRKVDDLWIDAAKDWCKEASVTEKAPIDIYAATGIPDLDKIPDGSTADQIYASRTEKDPQKEAAAELAGICIVCNRDVYHRAGKPGEYDHKCEQTSEGQSIIRKRIAYEMEQWMGDNWTRDYPLAAQETDKILDRVFGEASDSMAHLSEDYAKERQTPELPQSPESESKDV